MKHITEEIRDGLINSSNPEVVKTAKQFMKDNGFRYSVQGKMAACNEVGNWAENAEGVVSLEFITAIKTAIMCL